MIAAIYARKSTDQSSVADEEKSVPGQIERARAFAEKNGWTVTDEHVYEDGRERGASGAEFARRPGLVALLNSLKPRPPFDVLLLYDADRLGREQIETRYVMKQIHQAGVRIYEVKGGGRELALDSPIDKMMSAILTGAAEIERHKASERTRDALVHKAERGYVTGGCVFGYTNVRKSENGQRGHVERQKNEPEAAILIRLFTLTAQGSGERRVAKTLNDEHALAPKPRRKDRPTGWSPSTVHDALRRDLYRGLIVWGKRKKRDAWGQKRPTLRPKDDWTIIPAEHLRIISDDLWEAAHERLRTSSEAYVRATDGKLHGKPGNGIDSKYLLTGLAVCAVCGGALTARQSTKASVDTSKPAIRGQGKTGQRSGRSRPSVL